MMRPTTNTPTSIKIVCHQLTLARVDPDPVLDEVDPVLDEVAPAPVEGVLDVVLLIRSHTPRYFEPCKVPIPMCYRGMRNPTSQTVAHKYDLSGSSRPRPHFDKGR